MTDVQLAPSAADQPIAVPPTFTFEQIMAQFLRWDASWADTTIQFSFYGARPAHLAPDPWWTGFQAFSAAQREATYRAFDLIADVVNLDFLEVADNQAPPGPDNRRITFGASTTFPSWATAAADVNVSSFERVDDDWRIYSSETLFNFSRWSGSYEAGTRNFSVLLHEILHGLGLPHPGDYNRNADEPITYQQHADYAQDSGQYTVMSYFGAHETGANHLGSFAGTLLLHDVAAMQLLYGANMTTRTGDTVYGFNSTAGRASYDFNLNFRPVVTLWDAGGLDTLDCSGYAVAQVLDLREGVFSNVGGLTGNLSIAFGAVIENATGGAGSDQITGNGADNILTGGAGDDWLFGGGGQDTFIGGEGLDVARIEGRYEDHGVVQDHEGRWIVLDSKGRAEVLEDIEIVRFDDWSITPGDDLVVCRFGGEETAAKDAVMVEPSTLPGEWLF